MSTVSTERPRTGLTGIKVLAILLGFFVTVLAVDTIMIVGALQSRPGLVTDHAYERGLAHNEVLAAEARQVALGWRIAVTLDDGKMTLIVRDRTDVVLVPDRVELRLIRPTEASLDRTLIARPLADGGWQADLDGIPAGQWEVAVMVVRGTERMDLLDRVVIR